MARSIIKELQGHWRNTIDYSCIYTDEHKIIVEVEFVEKTYSMEFTWDDVYCLSGTDEIIFHKNLMDFAMYIEFCNGNTSSEIIAYILMMLVDPYDPKSIEQAWLRRSKK